MNRQIRKIIRILPAYFILILAFFFVVQGIGKLSQSKDVFSGSVSGGVENVASQLQALNIDAQSAISVVTDLSNSKVLFKKNEQRKLSIASIAKLMTAVIVLENVELSEKIGISKEAQDTFFAKDLLYAMLIGSDNAAAEAFSESIGKDKFVELMNKKAKEIGLSDTSFLNPTGLGLDNFSTAQDLAKLAEYLLKEHRSILDITVMSGFDLYTADGKVLHKITNTDELLKESSDFEKRIIGGKTGETRTAGECLLLVLKAKNDKDYLINVILNSKDRFGETKKIINWLDSAPEPRPVFDPDSLNWEQTLSSAPWQERDSDAVLVYKDKIWLMGGLNANKQVISPGIVDYEKSPHFSDVWSSEDGLNWQLVSEKSPWGNRRSIQVVDFKGKMWLMGGWGPEVGYKNDVWSSEDGLNWKKEIDSAAWPAREGHSLLVFKDKLWLLGGVRYDKYQLFNDVWYSDDGVNWIEATNNAGWSARWDHGVAVFKDKLWLAGGMVFGGRMFNDVWSSEDGKNWSLANAKTDFQARQGHYVVDYKNKLWVVGRLDAATNGGVNDVWYSDDGVNWQKTKNNPLWLGREDFGAIVFKDKVWILGGMDKNWTWRNDIWYSTSNIDIKK